MTEIFNFTAIQEEKTSSRRATNNFIKDKVTGRVDILESFRQPSKDWEVGNYNSPRQLKKKT